MSNVISCIFGWNEFDRSGAGLLGTGQRLAKELNANHSVLVVGGASEKLLHELASLSDAIHLAEHPLLATYHSELTLTAIAEACRPLKPRAILLGNDLYSQELEPRLAHRLGGSAAGDALSLTSEGETILVTRPVYGGKAQATVALRRAPAVVWMRARAQAPPKTQTKPADAVRVPLSLQPDDRIKVVSQQFETKNGAVRLEDARFIVSGIFQSNCAIFCLKLLGNNFDPVIRLQRERNPDCICRFGLCLWRRLRASAHPDYCRRTAQRDRGLGFTAINRARD